MSNPFDFANKSAVANKREIARIYRDQAKRILDKMRDVFDKYSVNGRLSFSEMQKFDRYKKTLDTIAGYMRDLKKQNNTAIKDGLIKTNIEAFDKFKKAINKYFKQDIPIGNITKTAVKDVINSGTIPLNNTLSKNDVLDLNRIDNAIRVTISQADGATFADISKSLRKELEKSFAQSIKVLTTEENRSINSTKEIAFQRLNNTKIAGGTKISTPIGEVQLAGNVRKQWIHGMIRTPVKPRPGHVSADGQIADEEGNFTVNGFTVQQPGMFGVPSQDINCSCGVGVVLVDDNGEEIKV